MEYTEMNISKIHIENFKMFKGAFDISLRKGMNILVGDNESGKSTIIEAIHLALTGLYNGRYLRNDLTQYIFNNEIVDEYINSLKNGKTAIAPPHILIEVFIDGKNLIEFWGDGHSDDKKKYNSYGISLKILFDDKYQDEYEKLIGSGEIKTLPIEYYNIVWSDFARNENITTKVIPIKSALIDSSSHRLQNGSDIYISHIVKELLDIKEIVEISQAHRNMKDSFMDSEAIKKINEKIKTAARITEKEIELSVELSSKNAWENSLMTYLDRVPFHYIGKGEQCIVKTNLALSYKKAKRANIILLEEPENHLSFSKLNQLVDDIKNANNDKQILISTHSSFVANKLGLDNLIFLNNKETMRLSDLTPETQKFFDKLSGYDTLRLILCKRAILVEGDSDELVVQKAFMVNNGGKLPIEKGIDVISVGTSFLRFLEIAQKIKKSVSVVTDNDGDPNAVFKKYKNYRDNESNGFIKICVDSTVDSGKMDDFNYNTLEPKLLKSNGRDKMNSVFGTHYENDDVLLKYMKNNKTECALKVFETTEDVKFPEYILDAIKNDE
jgi:putative ATP-dependent endonuclease of OLD family